MAEISTIFSFPVTFRVPAMVFDNTRQVLNPTKIMLARMITERLGMTCFLNIIGVGLVLK